MPATQPPDPSLSSSPRIPRDISTPATVAIVVGLLGTLLCGGVQFVGTLGDTTQTLPDGSVIRQDPSVVTFRAALSACDLVASAALLAAGIGGVMVRRWARPLGVAAAAAVLALGVVRLTASLAWINPQIAEVAREVARRDSAAVARDAAATQPSATQAAGSQPAATQPTVTALTEMAESTSKVLPAIAVLVFLVQLVATSIVIRRWTRPEVKAMFRAGWPPGTGG